LIIANTEEDVCNKKKREKEEKNLIEAPTS
jgi:hypothetical protein